MSSKRSTKMAFKYERNVLLHSPPELLDEILSYLSTREIRKLRSVCRYLNERFNDYYFCRNEIFMWRNICDTGKMIESLSHSNRSVWNIHIEEEYLVDNSIMKFFTEQGSYVNSLSLKNCHLPCGLLEAMLLKCDSLRSFSLEITQDFNPRNAFDSFSTFESNSVVRPDLRDFKLVINKKNWLPDSVFCLFFNIFPNINRLYLEIDMVEERRRSNSVLDIYSAKTPVTYTSIFVSLSKVNSNMESLSLHFPLKALQIMDEIGLPPMPKLKHLSLKSKRGWVLLDQLKKWRQHFQHVSSFDISTNSIFSYRLSTVLVDLQPVQIIYTAPKWGPMSSFTHEEFLALVKSEVKVVKIRDLKLKVTMNSVRRENLPVNVTVKDMDLFINSPVRVLALSLFPEYFRGLVHLRLEYVSNAVLQTIFKYQVNLQSLYLGDCRLCTIDGFIDKYDFQYSIGDLKNLEHLTLHGIRKSILNSKQFNQYFNFPRLKYLNIRCYYKNGRHKLKVPVQLFESFVNLEAVRLSNFANISYSTLRPLFRKLFHLRYLRCEGFDVLNENFTFVDLSEYVFKDIDLGATEDFFDKITNKIIFINRWLGFRYISPKISSFSIDWIEF